MKKVLIISEWFYPSSNVGAVRPTKIAKYLTKHGYRVDVVTGMPVSDENNVNIYNKIYSWGENIPFAQGTASTAAEKKHSGLYRKIYSTYYMLKNISSARSKVKKLKLLAESELKGNEYDAVISSFGPLSSLLCGMHYKKTHPRTKWICDFRDPLVVDVVPGLFHPYYRYLQNKACKKADVITTVSNGYFERICGKKYSGKARMIPNGYDRVDIPSPECAEKNDKLTFAYAGLLYDGKRDISPLFSALRELVDEGSISKEKISFEYAGNDGAVLMAQAENYGMEDIVNDRGRMPRKECLEFQFAADILVLATWNYKSEIGVFPGKLLEYMLMQRPIISLTCGSIPNGEVTQTIRRLNLGVAYEQANNKEDISALKSYLKKACGQFNENGKVEFSPNQEAVDRYDWKNLIEEIEELL